MEELTRFDRRTLQDPHNCAYVVRWERGDFKDLLQRA